MRGRSGGIWYKLNTPSLVILQEKYESEAELMGQPGVDAQAVFLSSLSGFNEQ